MKNKKSFSKRAIITTISVALLTTLLTVFLTLLISNNLNINSDGIRTSFIDYQSYYSGSQVPISSSDETKSKEANVVSMTTAAAAPTTSYSDNVITIATAKELYLFSETCYAYSAFLGYDYKLLCNIDCDDYTKSDFVPIGWSDTTERAFTGSFDGQGYDIANLDFVVISSITNATKYSSMKYFAMFSENTGEVKNFGLIDPNIAIAYLISNMVDYGVANVCGLNNGDISGVYVNQLSTALTDECGITAAGGYRVAGFVVENGSSGEISESYYATNSIYNYTLQDVVEYADITLKNSGSISTTYFYNTSIDLNTSSFTEGDAYVFNYSDDLGLPTKSGTNYPGTMVENIDDLNSAFASNTAWRTESSDRTSIAFYYSNETPVRRVFSNAPVVTTGIDAEGIENVATVTIKITNVYDFLLMYELMNGDAFFASAKATYQITADINLEGIPGKAYAYVHGIGSNFVGQDIGTGSVTMIDGGKSKYPTIYNADILNDNKKVVTTGLNAYGLFSYLTGSVTNLNVVSNIDLDDIESNTNAKAIGVLAGYIEGGSVTNVNTYITATNTTSSTLGEYYLGGICGVLGGEASITNSVSSGSITLKADSSYQAAAGYMVGCAVGGAVGYIENSLADINTLLNAVTITTELGSSSATYAVGGVIGAGYTRIGTKLENLGTINVGTTTKEAIYNKLYVAGIIGRHLGEAGETSQTAEVNNFTNQGQINLYGSSSASLTYVAGIENADIQTSETALGQVTASQFVDKANNILFYASAMTNRANVNVLYNSDSNILGTNGYLTNGINILSGNGFDSQLSSIYSLDNNNIYNGTSRKLLAMDTQSVDISVVGNYAGVINVYNGSDTSGESIVKLSAVYNLRDINFTMSTGLTFDGIYSGAVNGSFINYTDVRNEGALSFDLNVASSTEHNLYVNGVFDELSLGSYAQAIYNGGDITLTDSSTSDMKINIYVSGICRKNLAVLTDVKQNPLNSTFDSSLVGSLNDVINNGKIKVTSSDYDKTNTYFYTSNSQNQPTAASQTTTTNLVGSVYASGIVYSNSGIISNAFNLGDIQLDVYSKKAESQYFSAGIACKMTGEYAQIRDSANNGSLQVINMCNSTTNTGRVVVGGIVAINVTGFGSNTEKKNISQVIAFTINYGTLNGVNGSANQTSVTVSNSKCFVGGIIGRGVCNIVNILNYGNIYGSEVVGSMIGAFRLSDYNEISTSFANSLNYGNVYAVEKYRYNGGTLEFANYNIMANLTYIHSGFYSSSLSKYYYLGAMFGIIDYSSKSNISIRYVINFFSGAPVTQDVNQLNEPTTTIDTQTFITTKDAFDKFGGSYIKYAPLSTITDTQAGNIGVFSEKFIFRRAINGDLTVVDYDTYVTDAYIADFFQFVRFDKVNELLLEKIGWKNIAYINAAEQLARDVATMAVFVSDGYSGLTKTSTTVSASFTSSTWYESIDDTLLVNFLTEILSSDDGNTSDYESDDLKEILEYILFDEECISDVTSSIRATIIDTIMSYYEAEETDAYTLLQTLLYDELLAKVVSGDSTDYAAVQTKIRTVLASASDEELEEVLSSYLDQLISDTSNEILDPLFNDETGEYYLVKKMELIQTLLADYSSDTLALIAQELLSDDTEINNALKYINYLSSHTDVALTIYSNILAYNSTSNSYYLSALNEAFSKYDISVVIEEAAFDTDNIEDEYTSVTSSYQWINGTKWTYSKDYTELWNLIKDKQVLQNYIYNNYFTNYTDPTSSIVYPSLVAKATEWNSTYQSNDAPSIISETTGTNVRDGNFRSQGGYNTSDGVVRPTTSDRSVNIPNRFIYTPDEVVSNSTYYYGPFMASSGPNGISNSYQSVAANTPTPFSSFFNKNYNWFGHELYNSSAITSTTKEYVPLFISTNENITQKAILSSQTQSTNKTVSPFYWSNIRSSFEGSSHFQWVSDYILDNSASDSNNYLFNNYNTGEYIVDYYDFTPGRVYTYNSDIAYTNPSPASTTITLSSTKNQTYANLDGTGAQTHPLRNYYLKGYASSDIYTGIWYPHSVWYDNNVKKVIGCYLTAKSDFVTNTAAYNLSYTINGTTYTKLAFAGVQTTQYTYYQISDLVKLDGVRTKGKSSGTDSDEVAIISALMTNILSTDAGKKVVVEALGAYASTTAFTSSQTASALFLASALKGTSFASNTSTNIFAKQSNTALNNEYYYYYSAIYNTTLKEHLESLIADVEYTDLENLSMLGASNVELFKKILLLTLANDKYDNDSGTNTVTSTDITYFIYKYATYLRSLDSDITDSEIAAKFAGVTAADLTALTALSDLDWDSFITTIGGDADASQEDGVGSYTDIKALYEALGSKDGADIAKVNAYPFKIADDTLIAPSASTINMTLSAGTKSVDACYTYEASSTGNNIGYYIGADIKVYNKAGKANFDTFYYPNGDGTPYTLPTVDHAAPDDDIVSYLSDTQTDGDTSYRNGDYLIRLTGTSQLDINNESGLVAVENAYVGEWHGTLLAPSRCIWVAPIHSGTFKFVLSNIENSEKMGFRLYKLTRSTPGNYSTYFSNLATVIECNKQLQAGKSYYYEIDITDEDIEAGYEYAIATGDGYKPYITYIDIGASGTDNTKVKYPNLKPIEDNYDDYYASLSDYASYLASNLIDSTSYSTKITTTSITVSTPTILLVKADDGYTVTVSGATTYDVDGVSTTISSVKKNTNGGYRAFYLSGGTYTITASDAVISEILQVNANGAITYNSGATSIYYDSDTTDSDIGTLIFKGTNYTNLSSFNLDLDNANKILETLLVVYPTMIDSSDNYYFFDDSTIEEFTSTQLKEIIKLLAKADYSSSTSVLGRLITNLPTKYYDNLLLSITDDEVIANMIKKIIEICDENNYADSEDLIIAAYLGDDLIECSDNNQLTSSILYTILSTYASSTSKSTTEGDTVAGFYQFIEGDTTVNATKFTQFLKHLGVSANLEGYGIFALASSHGIKNGTFIPDNLDLMSMDAPYNTLGTDADGNSIIQLLDSSINSDGDSTSTKTTSTTWRDNTGTSSKTGDSTASYDISDETSVNYAFRVEMKQLKLSISTSIFELDLTDSSAGTIYASSSTIDVDNGTITYYVLETDLATLKTNTAASISLIDYAETATFVTNNSNQTTINLTGGFTNSSGNYQVKDAITVTAEDTTVYTAYDIILVGIPADFTVTSDTSSLTYSGGTVTLTITCANIPDTFDFKSFFSIKNGSTSYAEGEETGWIFNASTRNNGIVKNGSATLVIDVLKNLPGGTLDFIIDVFSTTKTIEIEKALNTEANITKLTFEDDDLTTNGKYVSGKVSSIKFGRAYDYSELTDYESENFYLAEFEISANATVVITATYADIADGDGRIRYSVKFVVKSESGTSKTYYHYLDEMTYFSDLIANVFEDGEGIAEEDLYDQDFEYDNSTYSASNNSLSYTNGEGTYICTTFNRGLEPEYRIKYILSNFYTLGDVTYSTTDDTLNNGCAVTLTYAGLTVTVTENNEPGVYKFDYIYTSTGTWNGGVGYERQYTFPTFFIYKDYSTDSLLKRLTFLDQSVIIGNTATVMKTNTATSSSILAQYTTTAIDGNETTYSEIFAETEREIEIKKKTITYAASASSTSITDYFALGTVSDSDLSFYVPTFGIEKHAQIYQYTTLEKLTYYGADKQGTKSDADVLTNHDTMYLYVPFTNSTETVVRLVEIDSNCYWTNVYTIDFDGTNGTSTKVGAFGSGMTTLIATTTATSSTASKTPITIGGYYVSADSGEIGNQSLYMDYIGDPVENHFWYVSYVVFSEAALHGKTDAGCQRYYHISIVDATNTIQFIVTIYAVSDLDLDEIYLTITENIYKSATGNVKTLSSSRQISAYGYDSETTASNTLQTHPFKEYNSGGDPVYDSASVNLSGYKIYNLYFTLQTLPAGYFKFFVDLPQGYVATSYTDKKNRIYTDTSTIGGESAKTVEEGTYLAPTSIITQKIALAIVISSDATATGGAWARQTAELSAKQATYGGYFD